MYPHFHSINAGGLQQEATYEENLVLVSISANFFGVDVLQMLDYAQQRHLPNMVLWMSNLHGFHHHVPKRKHFSLTSNVGEKKIRRLL